MKIFSIVLLGTLIVSNLFALDRLPVDHSIEWQSQFFEQQIKNKVSRALNLIISEKMYLLDVKIEKKTPTVDDLDLDGAGGSGGAGAGNDSDQNSKENDKGKIKFIDAVQDLKAVDYVLLSKLGIQAPLIDDFVVPDNKAGAKGEGKQEDASKTEKAKLSIDQTFDIFNNLESVVITVYIDNTVSDILKKQIEVVLNAINFNIDKSVPKVGVKYIDMGEPIAAEPVNYLDVFEKFALPVGIFLSVIVFGLMLLPISKRLSLGGASGQGTNISIKNELPENDSSGPQHAIGGIGASDTENISSSNGVERFINLYEKAPENAILLIKKWLRSDDVMPKKALCLLVQDGQNQMLGDILSQLSRKDKDSWKNILSLTYSKAELADAQRFMTSQVVEEIMNFVDINDPELQELLAQLSPEKAVDLIKKDQNVGSFLMNASSPVFISTVISKLDESELKKIASTAKEFDFDSAKEGFASIKQSIKGIIDDKTQAPFITQMLKLFPSCELSKEKAFLDVISQSVGYEVFSKLVLDYCPYSCINILPETFLSSVLDSIDMKQKVILLLLMENSQLDRFKELCAKTGSRAREMLELELQVKSSDKSFMQMISKDKELYQRKFLDSIRSKFAIDLNMFIENEQTINAWIDENFKFDKRSNVVPLRAA